METVFLSHTWVSGRSPRVSLCSHSYEAVYERMDAQSCLQQSAITVWECSGAVAWQKKGGEYSVFTVRQSAVNI